EPAALDCLVPTLLLQPLVENAIRHGIEPSENAGLVRLTARRQDGLLVMTVEDDGVGLPNCTNGKPEPEQPEVAQKSDSNSAPSSVVPGSNGTGTGIGLNNLRARLETLYGTGQQLELVPRAQGGVTVIVRIPWRLGSSLETAEISDHL